MNPLFWRGWSGCWMGWRAICWSRYESR
jgi:hypothetical protein